MSAVLNVFDLLLGLALIGVVLLQRSEGGGLGLGGSSNSFMSVRGTANFLTRLTAILAGLFMLTSLVLALLVNQTAGPRSIFETGAPVPGAPGAPATPGLPGSAPAPAAPVAPTGALPPAQPALPAAPAPAAPLAPPAPAAK